ncbi:MAG: hypothetical protein M1828_005470 [Chrysothrix sp. TS-e1954]|nr:MAG: hypothetical protein M1828_005470 [Chrysothrix sp. TS-e1954]
MAKLVGERWQLLPSDVREHYEQRASAGKEKYNMLMAEYRRTEDYSHYQKYLADFKAKNVAGKSTGERPKMRPENSTETQSSHESLDDLSPQATASRLYNKASHGSDGTQFDDGRSHVGSPAASHTSILQSATASPTSNQGSRFSAYDLIIRHNGSHGDQDGLRALPPTTSVGFPPSSPPNDRLPMVLPQSSTKEIQEGTRLPVSLPSISRDPMVSYTRDTSNSPGTTFQAMNIGNDRARRTLPTLPSLGLGASTIEARARVAPSSPRDTGSGSAALAALLRAGELARETDDRSIAVSRNSR